MKNIKIQIIGETGSGKSTINTLILQTLLENGFDVKFNETLEDNYFETKLEKVRNNCFINLEVVQSNKNWNIEELNVRGTSHPLENILGQKTPVTIDENIVYYETSSMFNSLKDNY